MWSGDNMRSAILIFIIIASLLSTPYIFDLLKNEVTVYSLLEHEKLGLLPLNRAVYKVFPNSHNVIYWLPGVDEAPQNLGKCIVRDRLNWQCQYSDGSATLIMNDGEFIQIPVHKSSADSRYRCVSCWTWWMAHIKIEKIGRVLSTIYGRQFLREAL